LNLNHRKKGFISEPLFLVVPPADLLRTPPVDDRSFEDRLSWWCVLYGIGTTTIGAALRVLDTPGEIK